MKKPDPWRAIRNNDVLLHCLRHCDIEMDGEAVHVRVRKQCSPHAVYRLDTAKAIHDALQDLQKQGEEEEK